MLDDNIPKRALPFLKAYPNGIWIDNIFNFKKIIPTKKWDIIFLDNDMPRKISYDRAMEENYEQSGWGAVNFLIQNPQLSSQIKHIVIHTGNNYAGKRMYEELIKFRYNAKIININLIRDINFDIVSIWNIPQYLIDQYTSRKSKKERNMLLCTIRLLNGEN